jgi:lipooligosaccharide transport system ATP-binding protein
MLDLIIIMTSSVIKVQNLTKKFDKQTAVDEISFEIPKGIVFSLLGPNGAGKSTTIRMMSCTLIPTSGEITVLGKRTKKNERWIKNRLGIVPQTNNLDPDFSVRENLQIYSYYQKVPIKIANKRIDELLDFVKLTNQAKKNADLLSGGMKRRLILARALLNDPDVLILDEPTTGLDVQARYAIWEMIKDLRSKGKTIILTTHYMAEAEELSDYVAIMDTGKIIAQGTVEELRSKIRKGDVIEIDNSDEISEDVKKTFNEVGVVEEFNERLLVYVPDWKGIIQKIQPVIKDLPSIRIRSTTLEDVFVALTGRELRDL